MQAFITRDDMRTVRNTLRWISIGVQPSARLAASVSEVIKPLPSASVTLVQRVIDEALRGVIASQNLCGEAEKQLQVVFDNCQPTETPQVEVHRG